MSFSSFQRRSGGLRSGLRVSWCWTLLDSVSLFLSLTFLQLFLHESNILLLTSRERWVLDDDPVVFPFTTAPHTTLLLLLFMFSVVLTAQWWSTCLSPPVRWADHVVWLTSEDLFSCSKAPVAAWKTAFNDSLTCVTPACNRVLCNDLCTFSSHVMSRLRSHTERPAWPTSAQVGQQLAPVNDHLQRGHHRRRNVASFSGEDSTSHSSLSSYLPPFFTFSHPVFFPFFFLLCPHLSIFMFFISSFIFPFFSFFHPSSFFYFRFLCPPLVP